LRCSGGLGIAIVLSAVALAASACGGGGGAATSGAPAGGAPPPPAKANDIHPVPRDQVQDGGTFTWPIDDMPANFNNNEIDGTDLNGTYVILAMLPGLATTDAAANPVWDMDYLASAPTLTTEPKQVVTYELNPKAKWYDGTPITWEDLYWQWKASNGRDPRYRISSANGYEKIENVARGKNDYEAIVTYGQKFADWQALFAPFYPASTNKDPKIFNEGWKGTFLTTAGPFKLDHINQTDKTITLVRNDKWWGPLAKLDRLVFRVIEPDAQVDALANSEIDAMDVGPNASTYQRAKAVENVDLRVAGGPNFRHLTMNGTSPNLQDVRVRTALAMGIDRAAIARAMLSPLGIAPAVLNNHIFMENQHGYQDNSGEVGRYNPTRAAQLLDEAGWKLDGKVRKKDGRPLEIRMVIPSGVQTSRQESELVQNMLGQLGVTVDIDTVPIDDFFDKYLSPGQFDFTVFSWMGTAFPITSSKSVYVKPTKNAQGQLDIQQNYARIGTDQIDHLFDEAATEFDRDKAIAIANQADALIWQEVHSLTLYQRPEIYATRKNLVNFGAFGFASWIYQDIGWAKP
jgi:glutathione transport system substrate-binding protein